jgi:hypothetical protein
MQLTQSTKLKSLLTTATCALLGTNANAQTNELSNWQFDTALMVYSEAERVTAAEAIIAGTRTYKDDQILNLKLTIDSLTGASANGAVAQPNVQTFTRPSGKGQYQIDANTTPLDDTFKDTRVQLTGQWTQPLENNYTWSVGGNFSKEYDYMSLSANSNIAKDFNQKNTTLSAGIALAIDQIKPIGGLPKPFTNMVFTTEPKKETLASSDNKTTVDFLFGVTQVINRRMLVQMNYSYSQSDGYLTDPFKMLSIVNTDGLAEEYRYENRPDKRTKHAFYVQSKYHLTDSIIDASYRFMTDDWGINSHTLDLHYRINLPSAHYIEPHIRLYTQTAADFYQPFLQENSAIPEFASADYRIGEMDTYTVGVKYGMPLASGEKLAFRLEYYNQTPKNSGFTQPGVLADQQLYESIDAIIAQVSYSF